MEDRVESLEDAERRRRMEAADLERMLEEARELMKRAQRRRWVLWGAFYGWRGR